MLLLPSDLIGKDFNGLINDKVANCMVKMTIQLHQLGNSTGTTTRGQDLNNNFKMDLLSPFLFNFGFNIETYQVIWVNRYELPNPRT